VAVVRDLASAWSCLDRLIVLQLVGLDVGPVVLELGDIDVLVVGGLTAEHSPGREQSWDELVDECRVEDDRRLGGRLFSIARIAKQVERPTPGPTRGESSLEELEARRSSVRAAWLTVATRRISNEARAFSWARRNSACRGVRPFR
jgi:hypothetical protein